MIAVAIGRNALTYAAGLAEFTPDINGVRAPERAFALQALAGRRDIW